MFWVLANKDKTIIYKKWRIDVWGFYVSRSYKIDNKSFYFFSKLWKRLMYLRKSLKRFIYYLQDTPEYPPYERLTFGFFSLRLCWFFYLTVRHSEFKRYFYVANKKKGSFFSHYCLLLEGRITILLFRMNFISNLFLLKCWVSSGIFLVNGITHTFCNYNVKLGHVVSLCSGIFRQLFLLDLLARLKFGVIYFNTPRYLFLDYFFFFGFVFNFPVRGDLAFPQDFSFNSIFDIFRGSDFFN